jgi:lysophospholipase L1-like esterase
MRARSVWWALVFAATTATGARAAADPPYYLALGDSLAVGIQPAANGDYVPTNQGYVDDLYAFYRTRLPTLQLAKLGCSSETTSSMITGLQSACYTAPDSQLLEAVAFLQSHRVVLVTIDIGADNLLRCFSLNAPIDPACVTGASTTAANDLAIILATLRAHAPHALIVGMNYYDPFAAAWIFGSQGQQLAAASITATLLFNQALEGVYAALQVRMADVESTFRTKDFPANVILALGWTWMSAPPPRGPDVHPNDLGYAAIASSFAKAIGRR